MRKFAYVIVAVGLVGCEKKKDETAADPKAGGLSDKERGEVLAKVDDISITVGEFTDRINKQSPYIRARYTSLERKKEFLQNLIRFEVLAKEAEKRGFHKDPEVVRTMKQVMIQKLTKDVIDSSVKLADIADDQLKKFYDEHIDEYRKPEQVRASAIIVKDQKTASQVVAEANKNTQDNKVFRDLVTKHSTDEESKARGGDLRYFGKDDPALPKPVVEAAFALEKIGDVAGPVKTDKGFYVVKLTGRRKELNRTFEEVKRQIQNRLYRDTRTKSLEDFVANLRTKAKVQIYDDKLNAVPIDTTTPTAPGPGAADLDVGGGPPADPSGLRGKMPMPPGMPGMPGMPEGHPGAPQDKPQ
ncbi:MAG: peptidyl-prolyl cis-trans isomerase [Myxococcota bacterium]